MGPCCTRYYMVVYIQPNTNVHTGFINNKRMQNVPSCDIILICICRLHCRFHAGLLSQKRYDMV